jgi:hypothetical protein
MSTEQLHALVQLTARLWKARLEEWLLYLASLLSFWAVSGYIAQSRSLYVSAFVLVQAFLWRLYAADSKYLLLYRILNVPLIQKRFLQILFLQTFHTLCFEVFLGGWMPPLQTGLAVVAASAAAACFSKNILAIAAYGSVYLVVGVFLLNL